MHIFATLWFGSSMCKVLTCKVQVRDVNNLKLLKSFVHNEKYDLHSTQCVLAPHQCYRAMNYLRIDIFVHEAFGFIFLLGLTSTL